MKHQNNMEKANALWDPVCGRSLRKQQIYKIRHYAGEKLAFCCPTCETYFDENPKLYLGVKRDELSIGLIESPDNYLG